MEVSPPEIDVQEVERRLERIDGVAAVHDLHIWTITSGIEAATVHLVVADDNAWHPVLDAARAVLDEYGVTHPTIQVEPADHVEPEGAI